MKIRYSLRSVLILVSLLSLLFGGIAIKYQDYLRQYDAVSKLSPHYPSVRWSYGNVVEIAIAPAVTEDQALQNTPPLSNKEMEYVSMMPHLTSLCIQDMHVTEEGLKWLLGLSELRELDLRECPIKDEGIQHLVKLKRLEILELNDTLITPKGLEKLKASLPHTRIYYGDRHYISDLSKEHSDRINKYWQEQAESKQ